MRKQLLLKIGGGVAVVIIVVGITTWFLHRPSLQIREIVVHGNSVISDSDLKKVTEEALIGKYFYLFPHTNTFIYPEKKIEASILTSFKQIESIDIVRTNFQTLAMEVEEQKPYALWCLQDILEDGEVQDICYFLNREGLVYSYAPNFTGNVFFRFYGDLDDGDPIGKYYLKVNNGFNKTSLLIDSMTDLDIVPIELHPLGDDDMELYIDDGSKILFTREQPSSEVLDNLKVVLKSETFKDENKGDVEYVDLRFGNKVFLKVK
ncbi:cell division protein FtsQ/DivIB [candidate division KSB1 bacterium]